MNMSELEANIHQVRKETNEKISKLADAAIGDSRTYNEAIQKLKDFRWKFADKVAITMIESAIAIVQDQALKSDTKNYR